MFIGKWKESSDCIKRDFSGLAQEIFFSIEAGSIPSKLRVFDLANETFWVTERGLKEVKKRPY